MFGRDEQSRLIVPLDIDHSRRFAFAEAEIFLSLVWSVAVTFRRFRRLPSPAWRVFFEARGLSSDVGLCAVCSDSFDAVLA